MSKFTYNLIRFDVDDNEIVTPLTVTYRWYPYVPATRIDPPEHAFAEFSHEPAIDLTDDEIAEIKAACAADVADTAAYAEERAADDARERAWLERIPQAGAKP
jgi:hypothetical protein